MGRTEKANVAYWGTTQQSQDFPPAQIGLVVGRLGEDGWEMVSATATHSLDGSGSGGTVALYFKRRVGEPVSNPFLSL
jgi:hypothetical protein